MQSPHHEVLGALACMALVMERAIIDYACPTTVNRAEPITVQRIQKDAEDWINYDGPGEIHAFRTICDCFDWDVDHVRKAIKQDPQKIAERLRLLSMAYRKWGDELRQGWIKKAYERGRGRDED